MIPAFRNEFPSSDEKGIIDEYFSIMTDHCECEALLAVCHLSMIENALQNKPNLVVLTSILHDKSGKIQTQAQEILHDVFVEQFMNSYGTKKFDILLAGFGLVQLTMHSCGGEIVPNTEEVVRGWYNKYLPEQKLRTELDWNGGFKRNVSFDDVISQTTTTPEEIMFLETIYNVTMKILGLQDKNICCLAA